MSTISKVENAVAYIKAEVKDECEVIELSHADSPVLINLNNGLLVSYLSDDGKNFSYIQNRDIEELKLNEQQLHEYGIYNLSLKLNSKMEIRQTEGIYAVLLDGNFEASLLLVDELWDNSLKKLTPNGAVVCIPCRDILAFCDKDSKEGITQLNTIISRIWDKGDHLISNKLFIRNNKAWIKFNP